MQQVVKIVRGIFGVIEKVFEVISMVMLVAMTGLFVLAIYFQFLALMGGRNFAGFPHLVRDLEYSYRSETAPAYRD